MTSVSLAVVIPTRNRAEMAITAVRYLRRQPGSNLQIFVSDNSANEEEVQLLANFCRELGDSRVTYMRTPGDLPQGTHWDWASREALARSQATHVTIHYDRKITRPGQAAQWMAVASRFPDKVFTYVSDFVAAEPAPLRLWQPPVSGRLYSLRTSRALEWTARGEALELGQTLPILSNCIVPRAVVETIVERFGTFCESTTADSCFAYRFCALFDEYLHLDRALTVLYGSHRSAAVGYLSGGGGDFADYRATWRGDAWLDAAPIPALNLGYNMLFHEYELVRREVGDRLPPLDRDGYFRDLGRGLTWVRDPQSRSQLRTLLEEHGWNGVAARHGVPEAAVPAWRRAYWLLRQRATLFAGDWLHIRPRSVSGFRFRSDEHALRYAVKYPSRPTGNAAHLGISDPMEVDFPD